MQEQEALLRGAPASHEEYLGVVTQLLALRPGSPRPGWLRATLRGTGFALQNLGLLLTGRWHRLGYACVNFGAPISMRAYARGRTWTTPSASACAC